MPPTLHRRHMLSLFAGALAAQGCARRTTANVPTASVPPNTGNSPARFAHGHIEGIDLPVVKVDPSRVIRTITGLRPYRPSGFVVRKDVVGDKQIIHNYGHGGGGMTLSWGSSYLAVRLAEDVAGKDCAVIGGGVMGLSTARLLQLRGARVTIYTNELPPNTTSNIAGAQWWPVSVFDESKRTDAFSAQYLDAARFSFRYFQNLVGPYWGVRWLPNYYLSDAEPRNGWIGGPGGVLHDLQIDFQDFGPGQHCFPDKYARRYSTMMIEPAVYLSTLLRELQIAGARVELRRFASQQEVLSLRESLVFNCTGLGAKQIFGDDELMPIKGQLSFVLPQPEVQYNLLSSAGYMFPRADGVLLGGTYEKGQWDLTPEDSVREQMVQGHQNLFARMLALQQAARRKA